MTIQPEYVSQEQFADFKTKLHDILRMMVQFYFLANDGQSSAPQRDLRQLRQSLQQAGVDIAQLLALVEGSDKED